MTAAITVAWVLAYGFPVLCAAVAVYYAALGVRRLARRFL